MQKSFLIFIDIIKNENLSFEIISEDDEMIFAGIEWLMPTIVITYISKSYFDSFLKEMGKDHYQLLKKGIILLWDKMVNKAPKCTVVTGDFSPNKIQKDNLYSLYFSIVADTNKSYHFKLLIETNSSFEEYTKVIENFLHFLEKFHNNKLDKEIMDNMHKVAISGTILIKFDKELNQLNFITLDDIQNQKILKEN